MNDTAPRPRINPWSIWLIVIIMLGGLLVAFNYLKMLQRQAGDYRPGKIKRIDHNIHLLERSGKELDVGDLEGKVWLVSHLFTRCPGQCAGMSAEMKKYAEEFKDDPLFHLVSVTMDPEYDTPEMLREFAKNHDLDAENWWFVTSKRPAALNAYMSDYFYFKPRLKEEKEKENERDIFLHDSRVALVDHERNIRGWYDLFNALSVQQLEKDLPIVLKEAKSASGKQ